ncbi:MAG: VCBS repeat-containing protein [Polyangia bacterium]|nr:VCBS repeat-containing protein [Polyangia bacterium]
MDRPHPAMAAAPASVPRRPAKVLPTPPAPPTRPGQVGEPWAAPAQGVERIALGDLDGDGRPEAILASHEGLWVTDAGGRQLAKESAIGHPNALLIPGAGEKGLFFVAWGYGRKYLTGPSKVVAYRYARGKLTKDIIQEKASQRPAVSALAWGTWKGRTGLLIGAFKNKYDVDLTFAVRQGAAWGLTEVATVRMANALGFAKARSKVADDLVVGRLYGDAQGTPGDAFLLEASGQRVPIAVQGGLRALASADLDGDGLAEILLGDGWAQAYRKDGRALLTQASFKGGTLGTERIGELDGEFMIQRISAADLDGDGRPEVLALGNASLTVLRRGAAGAWAKRRLAGGELQDFAVGDLDGDGKAELILVYPRELRRLKNIVLP